MRRTTITILSVLLLLPPMVLCQRSQAEDEDELLARAINSAIKDTATLDPNSRNEQLRRLTLACASCDQVKVTIQAFALLSDVDPSASKKIAVEASAKLAESGTVEMTLQLVNETKVSLSVKNAMLARAASIYSHRKEFEAANTIMKQITDTELVRMAKIEAAFFSEDREILRNALLSKVRRDVAAAKSGGWSEMDWAVSEIALLQWVDENELATELIGILDAGNDVAQFEREISTRLDSLVAEKKQLHPGHTNHDALDPDQSEYRKKITALLKITKREMSETIELIDLIEGVCSQRHHYNRNGSGLNEREASDHAVD